MLFLFYYSNILQITVLKYTDIIELIAEGFLGRECGAFLQLPDVPFLRKIELRESLKETTSAPCPFGFMQHLKS